MAYWTCNETRIPHARMQKQAPQRQARPILKRGSPAGYARATANSPTPPQAARSEWRSVPADPAHLPDSQQSPIRRFDAVGRIRIAVLALLVVCAALTAFAAPDDPAAPDSDRRAMIAALGLAVVAIFARRRAVTTSSSQRRLRLWIAAFVAAGALGLLGLTVALAYANRSAALHDGHSRSTVVAAAGTAQDYPGASGLP